jgi:hypothetical protein
MRSFKDGKRAVKIETVAASGDKQQEQHGGTNIWSFGAPQQG